MSRRGSKGGKRSPTKSRQRLQGAVSKPAAEKFDRFLFEAESPEMTNTSLDMRGQYFAHWLLGRDQILTKLKKISVSACRVLPGCCLLIPVASTVGRLQLWRSRVLQVASFQEL